MPKKGYKQTLEHRRNCSGENNGMFGKSNKWGNHEEKAKKLIGEKNSGEKHGMFGKGYLVSGEKHGMFGKEPWNKGLTKENDLRLICTEESKEKRRLAAIKYMREVFGDIYPCIGRNEKQILDEIAKSIGYRVLRQHPIIGYFPDGYVKELNLVIEVDERPKIKIKDIQREKEIINELNCGFVRIPDYLK